VYKIIYKQNKMAINRKDELCTLVEEFSSSLGFVNTDAMKFTSSMYQQQHQDDNCDICKNQNGSFHQTTNTISEELSKLELTMSQVLNKSKRKSRKSVCAIPRILSSSSESSDEEEATKDSDVEERHSVLDDSNDNLFFTSKKSTKSTKNVIMSSDDEVELNLSLNCSIKKTNNENKSKRDIPKELTHENINQDEDFVRELSQLNISTATKTKSLKRKSVCVTAKFISSSESSDNDSEEDINDDEVVNESKDESIFFTCNKRPTTKRQHVISSDEDSDSVNVSDDNLSNDNNSSSEDEYMESEKVKATLFKNQTPIANVISDEDEEAEKENNDLLNVSSDDENYENYVLNSKPSYQGDSDTDSNGSLDDFIVSDDAIDDDNVVEIKPQFKTPKAFTQPRKVLAEKKYQNLQTPKSLSRNILQRIQTPKSALGTPAYKREFNQIRNKTLKDIYKLYNETVFDNKLDPEMSVTWNKRMTKTAGFCYYNTSTDNKHQSRIELSDKVIDSMERLRDTLIHELCHAATWIIDQKKAGHGPAWKYWATKANRIHPDLPIISRCHQYEIHTKFNYQCNGCGQMFGRHSKSIDASRHRCSRCGGIPELLTNKASSNSTPRTPNAYALFLKDNFASVKKSNPGVPHKEVMQLIAAKFKASKLTDANKEN